MNPTKLNIKRTMLVGFAFFLIMAFWQAYDTIMPLILINKFGMNQTFSGMIMALDNVLAVFMLPLFGALSDKHEGSRGKRTPFIVIGTLLAVVFFIALGFMDNYQLLLITQAGVTTSDVSGLTEAEASKVLAARAWEVTMSNPLPFIAFIGLLLLTLILMSVFRSPAVALMPDVTVKPLRSKANAIINLMGTAGGIFILVLGMVFGTSKDAFMSYSWFIAATCLVMTAALVVFIFTVREKKWNEEMLASQAEIDKLCPEQESEQVPAQALTKTKVVSLILILASVALWYMGYNAVTSKYSVYATNILKQNFNLTLMIAQGAAIVAYIPVGILSDKLGRKNTILLGVAMLFAAFLVGSFIRSNTPSVVMYGIFALAGVAWATINVNSFPMVVELASGSNIGKYTGYYYTASMAAQIITPVLSGVFLDVSMLTLFPYAAAFVLLSGVTMLFVKKGDAQQISKKENEIVGDEK